MKKKSGGGGGGANWMDTYGDMVTLLLCFFVLLYSMSTISEDKWKAIVMSFNPFATPDQTEIVGGNDGPSADAEPLEPDPDMTLADLLAEQKKIADALGELFEKIKGYAEEKGIAESVEVTRGDGYVFITFRDTVFFNPDRSELTNSGKLILGDISEILNEAVPYIDQLEVYGHTAQGTPGRPNDPYNDYNLSSGRASNAAAYIKTHTDLEPGRIVATGFGQNRPVAPNDTEENRKRNRRVEIAVTGRDLLNEFGDAIEQYYTMTGTENPA